MRGVLDVHLRCFRHGREEVGGLGEMGRSEEPHVQLELCSSGRWMGSAGNTAGATNPPVSCQNRPGREDTHAWDALCASGMRSEESFSNATVFIAITTGDIDQLQPWAAMGRWRQASQGASFIPKTPKTLTTLSSTPYP